jgi:DNA (cytosine-5)-methyltransferase 1
MRNGECWEQTTLAQTIRGTESGFVPNGVDYFHTPNTTGLDGGSNSRRALRKRMEKYPTPQSNDAKNSVVRHRTKSLQVMLGGTIATENPQLIGGHLNPIFVEWLMGWPLGMTDLKPLVMDKSPCVQQPHGES